MAVPPSQGPQNPLTLAERLVERALAMAERQGPAAPERAPRPIPADDPPPKSMEAAVANVRRAFPAATLLDEWHALDTGQWVNRLTGEVRDEPA